MGAAGPARLPEPGEIVPRLVQTCGELVVIFPAAAFDMGVSNVPYEQPVHRVDRPQQLSRSAAREVTFDEWDACVNDRRLQSKRPDDSRLGGAASSR